MTLMSPIPNATNAIWLTMPNRPMCALIAQVVIFAMNGHRAKSTRSVTAKVCGSTAIAS